MYKNVLEIFLILVIIIMVSFLIWNQFNINDNKIIYTSEYSYNAIKIIKTDNSVSAIRYSKEGNPVKDITTAYLEKGKIVKMTMEEYFDSLTKAKEVYADYTKNTSGNRIVSMDGNVVTTIEENPEITYEEESKNITNNADFIKYVENNITKTYPEYTIIY